MTSFEKIIKLENEYKNKEKELLKERDKLLDDNKIYINNLIKDYDNKYLIEKERLNNNLIKEKKDFDLKINSDIKEYKESLIKNINKQELINKLIRMIKHES